MSRPRVTFAELRRMLLDMGFSETVVPRSHMFFAHQTPGADRVADLPTQSDRYAASSHLGAHHAGRHGSDGPGGSRRFRGLDLGEAIGFVTGLVPGVAPGTDGGGLVGRGFPSRRTTPPDVPEHAIGLDQPLPAEVESPLPQPPGPAMPGSVAPDGPRLTVGSPRIRPRPHGPSRRERRAKRPGSRDVPTPTRTPSPCSTPEPFRPTDNCSVGDAGRTAGTATVARVGPVRYRTVADRGTGRHGAAKSDTTI